jgi:hypothetical protein
MQQERRRFHRTQISKVAKIVFGAHDYLSINCTVLNLSSGGACIHLETCQPIPREVELTFDAARTLRACRVAWQFNGRLGLAFSETPFRAAQADRSARM